MQNFRGICGVFFKFRGSGAIAVDILVRAYFLQHPDVRVRGYGIAYPPAVIRQNEHLRIFGFNVIINASHISDIGRVILGIDLVDEVSRDVFSAVEIYKIIDIGIY